MAIRGRELTGAVVKKISVVTRPANRTPFRIMKADGISTSTEVISGPLMYWETPEFIRKKEFSTKRRQTLASQGKAMPGGGYPIENTSDLHNAVQAIGRAKNPGKTKAHIKSRARALGATDQLPDTWGSTKKSEVGMTIFTRLAKIMKQDVPPAKSEVTAIAVASSVKKADAEAMLNRIFPPGTQLELRKSDDVNFYVVAGAEEGPDDIVMKLDNCVSVVMSNVRKSLFADSVIPVTFADRVVDNCVFPGMAAAMDTMASTLWGNIMQAKNQAEAVSKIDEVFTDASTYMKTLIGAIPTQAFKAELSNLARVGGKLTLTFDGVNDVQGNFPMDPMASGSKDPNNGAVNMGVDGGSQGVDPNKGSDVDGDVTDVAGRAAGGTEVDDRLPGQKRVQGMKKEGVKITATKNGDGDGDGDGDAGMTDCPDCGGSGEDGDEECSTCGGSGEVKKKKKKSQSLGGGYTPADNGNRSSNDGVISAEERGGGNRRQVGKGDDPMLQAIAGLTKAVKSMQGEVSDIATRVVKTEEGMKRVRAALKSTVVADDPGEVTLKGEDESNGQAYSYIDTGMDRSWIEDDRQVARGSNSRN